MTGNFNSLNSIDLLNGTTNFEIEGGAGGEQIPQQLPLLGPQ